jgi:hypothetical protein
VVSELSLAWCIARDKFDPSAGVPFGAYLQLGMRNHINVWIDKQIGHSHALDLDQDAGDESGASIHEVIPDDCPLQDEVLGERQTFERNCARLSPEARKFMELLADPPKVLYDQLDAIQSRVEHARAQGISTAAPLHITGGLVLDLMGAERVDRNRIYGEVKALARQLII